MTIVRSTALVSGLTFGGYLVGLFAQILFARAFGAALDTDAWISAVAVPNFLAAALFASLAKAITPVFVDRFGRVGDLAFRGVSGVVNITFLGLALFAGLVTLFARPIADVLFPTEVPGRAALTADLLRIGIWAVPATGTALALASVYQGMRRFGLAAVSMSMQPVGMLLALLFLAKPLGIYCMAVGIAAGSWLQLLVLLPRFLASGHDRPVLALDDKGVGQILRRSAPLFVAAALIAVYPLLEKRYGAGLPEGELTWISYGRRPINLLIFLLAGPVSITSFTVFAEAAAKGDLDALRSKAWRVTLILTMILTPAAIVLAFYGPVLYRIVFERGEFGPGDTAGSATAMLLLLPQVIVAASGKVLVHVFLARGKTLVPLLAAIVGLVLYAALAPYVTGRYGYAGLAFLQTAAITTAVLFAVVTLVAQIGFPRGERLLESAAHMLLAAIAAAVVLYFCRSLVPSRWDPLWLQALVTAVIACVGGAVYLGVLAFFRNPHLAEVIRGLARRTEPPNPSSE